MSSFNYCRCVRVRAALSVRESAGLPPFLWFVQADLDKQRIFQCPKNVCIKTNIVV